MGDLILIGLIAFIFITFTLGFLQDMGVNKFLFCAATVTGYGLLGIGFIVALIEKLI